MIDMCVEHTMRLASSDAMVDQRATNQIIFTDLSRLLGMNVNRHRHIILDFQTRITLSKKIELAIVWPRWDRELR